MQIAGAVGVLEHVGKHQPGTKLAADLRALGYED